MPVKIAHAVMNELKKAKGGAIGDQGGEVVFAKWYAKNKNGIGWRYRIRPIDPRIAEAAAQMAETIVENQGIGYGQEDALRNTIYDAAVANGGSFSGIQATCDCSSMMLAIFALLIPGFSYRGNTGSMLDNFKKFPHLFEISRDESVLGSDLYARRGDLYLRTGHVLMVVSNGAKAGALPIIDTDDDEEVGITICDIIMDGISKWCNVRYGPGTNYEKIGIARVNEVFHAFEVLEEWYGIDFHGRRGYVFYEYASEVREGNV